MPTTPAARVRWLPWLLLVALVAAVLLLGPGLFPDDASDGADDADGSGGDAPASARLVGTGRPGVPELRERGSVHGRVTLDGIATTASVAWSAVDGPALPDEPGDRWAWLLDHVPPQGDATLRIQAGADGRFSHTPVPGTWHVEARCDDGSRGWTVVEVTADETTAIHLDVRSGSHALHGHVRWSDGRSFTGYVLARTDTDDPSEWTYSGRTLPPRAPCDAEGRFTLEGLPPGAVVLHAVLPGELVAGRRVQVPWPHPIRWVVDGAYRTLTGQVVDDVTDAPIPGARLRDAWGSSLNATRTGPGGLFTLRTDAKQLTVSAAGYTPVFLREVDAVNAMTVRLSAAARLRGRVLRADDRTPVEGAVVHAMALDMPYGDRTTVRSGADGAWSMPGAPSGAVSLFVLGGGVCSEGLGDLRDQAADPFRVEVPASGSLQRELYVIDSPRLEGRVLEADGRAAVDLWLDLHPTGSKPRHWLACRTKCRVADGTFSFSDLVPGVVWKVVMRRAPLLYVPGPSFLLRPGEVVFEEIRVPARRRAVLDVRDASTGAPLPHAYVFCSEDKIRADAEGRIAIEGLSLTWEDDAEPLNVEAPGYVSAWIDPWAAEGVRVVHLTPSAGVSGRIEGLPEGSSFDQVHLRVAIHVWHPIPVAPDGTWHDPSFPDVPDEIFAGLKRDEARWSASALAQPGDTDVVLTLTKESGTRWYAPVVWTVHVRDPQGRPVPFFVKDVFSCTRSGCSGSTGFTERSGTVTTQQGAKSVGWVRVRQAEDAGGRPLGYAPLLVGPLGAEGGAVEVVMEPGTAVEGRVVDESGHGIPGVRVDARCTGHRIPDVGSQPFVPVSVATVYADADGRFRLDGLAHGEHELQLHGGGRHVAPGPLTVEGGQRDVVAVMRAAHSVDVIVEDAQGRSVADASVEVAREGRAVRVQADGRGLARLVGLDTEATYELKVRPPASRHDLREVAIPSWRPAPITLRLAPGAGLEGRLLGPDGGPVPHVAVHLFRAGKRVAYDHTDGDGTFRFRGLELGETVGLAPEDAQAKKPEAPVLQVTTGMQGVVLRRVRGPALLVDIVGLPALDWLASVYLLDPATGKAVASAEASRKGRAVFPAEDLDPELSYGVLVSPPDTYPMLVGYRTGVRLREEPWTVTMSRGETLRARVANPPQIGPRALTVSVDLGWGIEGMIDPQGRILVPGVPPGRWQLVVTDDYMGHDRARQLVEVPGPEVVVELEPSR